MPGLSCNNEFVGPIRTYETYNAQRVVDMALKSFVELLGRPVVVSLSNLSYSGHLIGRYQLRGRIVKINSSDILVSLRDSGECRLRRDLRIFNEGSPELKCMPDRSA